MKRIISDKHVAIIKIMLSQGYSNRAIQDEFLIKHGQKIDLMHLQFIKKGEAYKDVRDDLNEKIFENHSDKRTKNIENIPDIKWALANGFSELEIIKVFEITRSRLHKIMMLFAPFVNISPEYNDAIRLLHRRKKIVNIDKNLVTKIKERYVISNGKQSFSEIGNAFKINTGTVSTILNLKKYSEYGKSYNQKIISIKSKKAIEMKKKEELKRRYNKDRKKIDELLLRKKQISDLISRKRTQLKVMSV